MKTIILLSMLILASCHKAETPITETDSQIVVAEPETGRVDSSVAVDSMQQRPDYIVGDFDGDSRQDTVFYMQHSANGKYGLKLAFANGKTEYLGMGNDVAGQGFDDMDWVGIFQKAPKGESYASNVDAEGEFLDEIPDEDWVTLDNDGIYVHAAESCGGGVIYLENGIYKWIQQE